eukprot:1468687-Rhodomonas_salina.1
MAMRSSSLAARLPCIPSHTSSPSCSSSSARATLRRPCTARTRCASDKAIVGISTASSALLAAAYAASSSCTASSSCIGSAEAAAHLILASDARAAFSPAWGSRRWIALRRWACASSRCPSALKALP